MAGKQWEGRHPTECQPVEEAELGQPGTQTSDPSWETDLPAVPGATPAPTPYVRCTSIILRVPHKPIPRE